MSARCRRQGDPRACDVHDGSQRDCHMPVEWATWPCRPLCHVWSGRMSSRISFVIVYIGTQERVLVPGSGRGLTLFPSYPNYPRSEWG